MKDSNIAEKAVRYILYDCDEMTETSVAVTVKELSDYLKVPEEKIREMEEQIYNEFDDYMGYDSVEYNKEKDSWIVTFPEETVVKDDEEYEN